MKDCRSHLSYLREVAGSVFDSPSVTVDSLLKAWYSVELGAKLHNYDILEAVLCVDEMKSNVVYLRSILAASECIFYDCSQLSLADNDVQVLLEKEKDYGSSWKRRGGIGAFMMLARKWDRIEKQLSVKEFITLPDALREDGRKEGILDDVADLRRYLILVESEVLANGEE